ncbi:MAG: amidohydrolase family protein [Planctomycetes bacterium]|nr:amidohydrolase family protein [Planctomycetota bacterium]
MLRANIAWMSSFFLEVLAIVGASVHTLDGSPAKVATVLIDGGKIVAVGADVAIPDGARRIEAAGLHLLPGLIDGYAGHDPEQDLLYTAAGVTTVVDHGNELSRIFEQRSSRARDVVPGPHIVTAGAVIDGLPPATTAALVAQNETDVQNILKTLVEQDPEQRVDFFAFESSLSIPAWKKLIELGHAQKMLVWGPGPKDAKLAEIVASGQDGLLFLDHFAPADGQWPNLDLATLDDVVADLARRKVAIVPLLRGIGRLAESPEKQVGELEYLSPSFAGQWATEWQMRRKVTDADYKAKAGRVLEKQRALVKKLFEAGVVLVPASGAPRPWLTPGAGLVRELVEWQAAGLPASAVLAAATRGNAARFGLAETCGAIAVGLAADLVLVRSDPELAAANLTDVEGVCVRGRYLARADLDAKRTALHATQQSALDAATAPLQIAEPDLPAGTRLLEGYSETASEGVRTAGERWAVVAEAGGATVFAGRRFVPGAGGHVDVEVALTQRVVEGALDSFRIDLKSGTHHLAVRGQWVAGQMRVERTLDGAHVDTKSTAERVGCVDVDSVTSYMLLARFEKREKLIALRFHAGLELEVVSWQHSVDPQGWQIYRTPSGGRAAELTAKGSLSRLLVQQGSGQVETRTIAGNGPGFAGASAK